MPLPLDLASVAWLALNDWHCECCHYHAEPAPATVTVRTGGWPTWDEAMAELEQTGWLVSSREPVI